MNCEHCGKPTHGAGRCPAEILKRHVPAPCTGGPQPHKHAVYAVPREDGTEHRVECPKCGAWYEWRGELLHRPPEKPRFIRTITVARPATPLEVGSVFRVVEVCDGIETHSCWRAERIELVNENEIAITGPLVGA